MSNKFYLIVQAQDGNEYYLPYQLANNPIAEEWMKKLKHVSKIPLDPVYTTKNDPGLTKELLNSNISADINLLNNSLGKIYDIKSEYNQEDCNILHSYTVKHQYAQTLEIRDIFHRLHRQLHRLEGILTGNELHWLLGEWGEAGGLVTTKHKYSPYDYYSSTMSAGNIYQRWAEFGKPPYTYWQDHDIEDIEHFLFTCKPHITFRPGFVLCIRDHIDECYNAEFEVWFKKYQKFWEEKYNAPPASAYSQGSVLLAEPLEDQTDLQSKIYTMKSIKLID